MVAFGECGAEDGVFFQVGGIVELAEFVKYSSDIVGDEAVAFAEGVFFSILISQPGL